MTHLTPARAAIAKAIGIVAVASTALLLTACGEDAPTADELDAACAQMDTWTADPGAQSIAIVLDRSKSTRDGGLSAGLTRLVTDAAGVASTLSVLLVDGAGTAPAWLVDDLVLNNPKWGFDTMPFNQAVENAAACVAARIGDSVPTAEGTDLGTSIQVAADRLTAATGPRRLVVSSDGLSNTGPIDLTGAIARTGVDTVVAKLDAAGYRPDLAGVDVTFDGLGVTAYAVVDGPSVTWLRNYYMAVCERAGAATCEAPVADQGATGDGTAPRSDAPADPDLVLPAIQFEFDESEVRFEPDSSNILPEADAALARVAACLRDGSTLTVIGHSAAVGDAASEQATASARATAVSDRILELAGHPAVTVDAFGVGATEPKSASGSEPVDRRVQISLTGVCG